MVKKQTKMRRKPTNMFPWVGGKGRLMKRLVPLFPHHRRYVSLFSGSGADILCKPPSAEEIYNDLNADIVNIFEVLRDDRLRKQLCLALEFTPYSRLQYIKCLELLHSATGCAVDRAWAFQVCSMFGYGGKDPFFATPGNFTANSKIVRTARFQRATEHVTAIARRFRQVLIENLTWPDAVKKYDGPDTFFYADPPYVPSARITQRVYQHEMKAEDHTQLAKALRHVDGLVMLSGYHNPIYAERLADWRQAEFRAVCSISFKNVARTEVVWMNYDTDGQKLNLK